MSALGWLADVQEVIFESSGIESQSSWIEWPLWRGKMAAWQNVWFCEFVLVP